MNLTQLNRLAETHKAERTSEAFYNLYTEARKLFLKIHIAQTVRCRRGDAHDAEGTFDDLVMKLAYDDDVRSFGEMLSAALRIKRLEVERGNVRREKRIQQDVQRSEENEEGTLTLLNLLTDGVSAEDAVITSLTQKKDAQKRELLSSLIDPGKVVDHDTRLIVSQFSRYPNVNALGKAIGIHHEVVKRKLRKLSRGYDGNRFGDVNEYLAV